MKLCRFDFCVSVGLLIVAASGCKPRTYNNSSTQAAANGNASVSVASCGEINVNSYNVSPASVGNYDYTQNTLTDGNGVVIAPTESDDSSFGWDFYASSKTLMTSVPQDPRDTPLSKPVTAASKKTGQAVDGLTNITIYTISWGVSSLDLFYIDSTGKWIKRVYQDTTVPNKIQLWVGDSSVPSCVSQSGLDAMVAAFSH